MTKAMRLLGLAILACAAGRLLLCGAGPLWADDSAAAEPATAAKLPTALVADKPTAVTSSGANDSIELKASELTLTDKVGKVVPYEKNRRLLVVKAELVSKAAKAIDLGSLEDNLYLVVDQGRLFFLHRQNNAIEGHITKVKLADAGSSAKGLLVFEIPDEPVQSLELVFMHSPLGNIRLPLLKDPKVPTSKPALETARNAEMEVGVFGIRKTTTYAGKEAPSGLTFVLIDMRAASLMKDRNGLSLPLACDWANCAFLVADGHRAFEHQEEDQVRKRLYFIPDTMTGAEVAFLAPTDAKSLELRMDFPHLERDKKDSVISILLEGAVPKLPARIENAAAQEVISGGHHETFQLAVTDGNVVSHIGDKWVPGAQKLLVLELSITNSTGTSEWIQTSSQLKFVAGSGEEYRLDYKLGALLGTCGGNVWVPAGQRRTFQAAFLVPFSLAQGSIQAGEKQAVIKVGTIPPPPVADDAVAKVGSFAEKTASAPASAVATSAKEPIKVGDVMVVDPSLKPKGLEGVGLTQADVDKAVLRGRQYLLKSLSSQLEKPDAICSKGPEILACYALLHSGATEDPKFAALLERTLDKLATKDVAANYVAGVVSMMAESYGEATSYEAFWKAVRHITESQGPYGVWSYEAREAKSVMAVMDTPMAKPRPPKQDTGPFRVSGGKPIAEADGRVLKRTLARDVGADGDNSVTQFSVLGLWSATRAGLRVDDGIWRQCLASTRYRQGADGSMGYHEGEGYGSMTCAYICTTSICLHELGQEPMADRGVRKALAWLVKNWTFDENPKHGKTELFYYIYSIERVGRILDLDFIGPHEWFPQGAKWLLAQQKSDGSWENKVEETSFAILFLTKATATLGHGDGKLHVTGPAPADPKLYVILDASTSMNTEIGGKPKFEIAQGAVESLVKDLPAGTPIALRVYGNKLHDAPGGVDEDSTLEIPMGKLDKAAFVKKLKGIYARGKTPIAFSLDKTAEDIAGVSASAPVSVLLLTDGYEDTAKKRDPVASAKKLAETEGITLHVIAFDIDSDKNKEFLRSIATAAGGRYWEVGKQDNLAAKLKSAAQEAPTQFAVTNAAGEKVAAGPFGRDITLPEGKYTLKTQADGKSVSIDFWINTGQTTNILYQSDKEPQPKDPKDTKPKPKKP